MVFLALGRLMLSICSALGTIRIWINVYHLVESHIDKYAAVTVRLIHRRHLDVAEAANLFLGGVPRSPPDKQCTTDDPGCVAFDSSLTTT